MPVRPPVFTLPLSREEAETLREIMQEPLNSDGAEEIEQLESENARLADACRRCLAVLNAALDRDDDRKQEAHQETMPDEMREAWHEEMRRDAFGDAR